MVLRFLAINTLLKLTTLLRFNFVLNAPSNRGYLSGFSMIRILSVIIFILISSEALAVLPSSITQREYDKFEDVSGKTAVRVTGTISTSPSVPSPTAVDKVNAVVMYDSTGAEFLRFIYLNYLGVVLSTSDKELDGVTAFTPIGAVSAYPNIIGFN